MRVAAMLASRALRRRRTAAVLLAITVAIAGAVALGCSAAARRTASTHARYLRATDTADARTGANPMCGERPCTVDDFAAIDGVATVSSSHLLFAIPEDPDGTLAPQDDEQTAFVGLGDGPQWALDRPLVTAGRLPANDADDEVFVDRVYADVHDVALGDELRLRSYGPDEAQTVFEDFTRAEGLGTSVVLHVVGVGLLGADLEQSGSVAAPPATADRFLPINTFFAITLHDGAAGFDGFARAVEARWGIEAEVGGTAAHDRAQRTMRPYVTALGAYAAIAAAAGLLLIGQAMARETRARADEHRILRAIGATRYQLRADGVIVALVPALAGALVAVGVAWAASGWSPAGPVRAYEPDSGASFDALVFVGGTLVWLVLATLAGTAGALLATRRQRARAVRGLAVSGRALPVSAAMAVRFVRPRGARASGVPTRTAITGLATVSFLVAGVVTFASGLQRLVDTPRLYGWNNDVSIFLGYQSEPEPRAEAADAIVASLRRSPRVEAVTVLAGVDTADVRGVTTTAVGSSGGGALYTIVSGRPPTGDDEIVLGTRTSRRADVGVGGRVTVRVDDNESAYAVVGTAVISGTSGDGAWLTSEGFSRIAPGVGVSQLEVRFVPGTSGADAEAALLQAAEPVLPLVPDLEVTEPEPPEDAARLIAIDGLPWALGAALAVAALVTLTHTLLLVLRARRHDLATLRACGYRRRQVWATTLVQSVLVVGAGLVVGLPLGTAFGRWLWAVWARGIGVVDTPVMPVAFFVTFAPLAIAAAVLVAAAPAAKASRQHVATVLRTE